MTMVTPTIAPMVPTAAELADARAWLGGLDWTDADAELIAELCPRAVYRAVNMHYGGGWPQFLRDGETAKVAAEDRAQLTLYRLTAYDAGGAIVFVEAQALGQDVADQMAADLMAIPDVLSVRCEPVSWGSVKERDTINGAMFTGLDLLTPITQAARRAGVDFDPEHVDPADLLDRLRTVAQAHAEEKAR